MPDLYSALLIRKNIILGLVLGFSLLGGIYKWAGPEATWRLWQVPAGGAPFMDVRVITDGAIAYRQGQDPLKNNVGDISKRRLNYPRIWQSLYGFGVAEKDADWIGGLLVFLFALGIVLAAPTPTLLGTGFMLLAVFSPAVILGLERGNTDLLMFFLLALAIAVRRSHWLWAWGIVMAAFILKLFPLAGLVVLLGRGRKAAWVGISAGMACAILYLLFIFNDLALIKEATPQGHWISYGIDVVRLRVVEASAGWGQAAGVLTYLSAAAVFGIGFYRRRKAGPEEEGLPLDAFRVSIAIYGGTFLLGTNFDYRQMFLLLAIPQLLKWSVEGRPDRTGLARLGLAGVYVSLWTLMAEQWLVGRPTGAWLGFLAGEAGQWSVLCVLVWLFFRTLPGWMSGITEPGQGNQGMESPADST